MTTNEWQQIYDDFNLMSCPTLPKLEAAWLDAYEQETGWKLPQSYRDFILVWGPGEFGTCVRISAPGYADCGDTIDMGLMHAEFEDIRRQEDLWLDDCTDPDLFRRLVVFGDDAAAGDRYCWDPLDVRSPEENEYAIYEIIHEHEETPKFVAGSFREFIMQRAIDPPNPIDEENFFEDEEDDSGGDCRYFHRAMPPLRMSDLSPRDRLEREYSELRDKVAATACKYVRSDAFEGPPFEGPPLDDAERLASLCDGIVVHLDETLREVADLDQYKRLPTPEEIQEFLAWRNEHKDEMPWW